MDTETADPLDEIQVETNHPTETPELKAEPEAKAAEAPEPEAKDAEAREEDEEDEAQKRIKRLAIENREAKRRLRALADEVAALRGQRQEQPDEDLQRRVREEAQKLAAMDQFNRRCDEIAKAGYKEFGETKFRQAVDAFNDALGGLNPTIVEAIADSTDHPHKLYAYLADNTDILEEMANLPPHRLGAAMGRLAAKLDKPQAKPVSKAPPPVRPVTGSANSDKSEAEMSMAEYMAAEDRKLARRGR